MSNTVNVTDATYDQEVLQSDVPVVVDFWAPWCGPCRKVAPIVDELSDELAGKVKFVKVNTDENPQVTARYGIVSIPTMHVYQNGEIVESFVGARPKPQLSALIAPYVN